MVRCNAPQRRIARASEGPRSAVRLSPSRQALDKCLAIIDTFSLKDPDDLPMLLDTHRIQEILAKPLLVHFRHLRDYGK